MDWFPSSESNTPDDDKHRNHYRHQTIEIRGNNQCDIEIRGINQCDTEIRGINQCDTEIRGINQCDTGLHSIMTRHTVITWRLLLYSQAIALVCKSSRVS